MNIFEQRMRKSNSIIDSFTLINLLIVSL